MRTSIWPLLNLFNRSSMSKVAFFDTNVGKNRNRLEKCNMVTNWTKLKNMVNHRYMADHLILTQCPYHEGAWSCINLGLSPNATVFLSFLNCLTGPLAMLSWSFNAIIHFWTHGAPSLMLHPRMSCILISSQIWCGQHGSKAHPYLKVP